MRSVVATVLGAVIGSGAVAWNGPRPFHQLGGTCNPSERWCLGAASVVRQATASPEGGPQALEGYTLIDTRGTVRLAMGVIANVEQAGAGDVVDVVALTSNGVLTGDGKVGRWTGVNIRRPEDKTPESPNQVRDFRAIQFDNGLYFTTAIINGQPALLLCPDDQRQAQCLVLKP